MGKGENGINLSPRRITTNDSLLAFIASFSVSQKALDFCGKTNTADQMVCPHILR
jgi:hypothetical protein